jgi:hypothetical protein
MALASTSPLMNDGCIGEFLETTAPRPSSLSLASSTMKHNTDQFLAPWIVIKLPTGQLDSAGNPIEDEAYSIKSKLNTMDFLKAESVKLGDLKKVMQWYFNLGTNGSVNGISIPPLASITKVQVMGNLWRKKTCGVDCSWKTLNHEHLHL